MNLSTLTSSLSQFGLNPNDWIIQPLSTDELASSFKVILKTDRSIFLIGRSQYGAWLDMEVSLD